jgi:hypothetical protein
MPRDNPLSPKNPRVKPDAPKSLAERKDGRVTAKEESGRKTPRRGKQFALATDAPDSVTMLRAPANRRQSAKKNEKAKGSR